MCQGQGFDSHDPDMCWSKPTWQQARKHVLDGVLVDGSFSLSIDFLTSSSYIPRHQVVTSLGSLYSSASLTAPVSLVVRFGTSTSNGHFDSIATKPLLLRMTASILTSGTTKFAVILGLQVRGAEGGLFGRLHGSTLGVGVCLAPS